MSSLDTHTHTTTTVILAVHALTLTVQGSSCCLVCLSIFLTVTAQCPLTPKINVNTKQFRIRLEAVHLVTDCSSMLEG